MKGKNCAKKIWHALLSAVDSQYINTWRPVDSRSANGVHLKYPENSADCFAIIISSNGYLA